MIRKNKRNLILIIFVIVTTLSAIGAYFTSYAMKNNIFTIGEICHDWQYLSKQEHLCSKCNAKEAHTWVDKNTYKECFGCKLKHSKIIYQLNGGKIQNAPTEYYSVDTINFTSEPTRDGYIFEGWTGSNGNTPQKNISIPKGQCGDKTYIANWKSLTLVDGPTFNKTIPDTATSVVFTDEKAPDGATLTNLADDGRNGVVGWRDGDIYKVSTQKVGQKIIANSSCYRMFYNKSSLKSIDFNNFDTNQVTNMFQMFRDCKSLTNLNLSHFDTGQVTDMAGMFEYCESLTNLDIDKFNTSQVTDMGYMFWFCNSLGKLDLSNFDTSNVTSMTGMFNNCCNLTSLDLSSFNTTKNTSMYYMFRECKKIKNLSLNGFNTKNVTDMQYMFYGCSELENLDISGFDTSSITNMERIFSNCDKLQKVKLGSKFKWVGTNGYLPAQTSDNIPGADGKWYSEKNGIGYAPSEIPSNTAATYVAVKPKSRTLVDGPTFNKTIPGTATSVVFTDEKAPDGATLTNLADDGRNGVVGWRDGDIYKVSTQIKGKKIYANPSCCQMFDEESNLYSIEFDKLDTGQVTDMSNMFSGCCNLQSLDLRGADLRGMKKMESLDSFGNPTADAYAMIYGCDNLKSINLSNANLSNVTSLKEMFANDEHIQIVDFSGADLRNVTDMTSMFYRCFNLQSVDFSGADLRGMKSMEWLTNENIYSDSPTRFMLYRCDNLKSFNLSNANLSNVTSMRKMFEGCISLQNINLSGADLSNVSDMIYMFKNCSKLQSIDLSGADLRGMRFLEKLANDNYTYGEAYGMLMNCYQLKSINLSNANLSNVVCVDDMFRHCRSLQNVDLSGVNFTNVASMYYAFWDCENLRVVKFGKKSAKVGHFLQSPSSKYITGADGKWYNEETGVGYAPADIPSNVAATYVASPNLVINK